MKKVYIDNIKDFIIIDDEDYEKVSKHKWHISFAHGVLRCRAFHNYNRIALPSYLTEQENSFQKVKGLDFRRGNIIIDSNKYRYRKPQKNSSSSYKGVTCQSDGRFKARIYHKGKHIFLGRYSNEYEAGKAYNQAVLDYWDGNGYLNDIDNSNQEIDILSVAERGSNQYNQALKELVDR